MSLWKVIVIASACTLALFIGILIYALYPTIRNVSQEPELQTFVNKPLTLKRDVFIYSMDEGQYRFEPLLMSTEHNYPYEKKLVLPAGAPIIITKFKTYRHSGGTGFTELYAVGQATTASGKPFGFEFEWGNGDKTILLHPAPWQRATDSPGHFPVNR